MSNPSEPRVETVAAAIPADLGERLAAHEAAQRAELAELLTPEALAKLDAAEADFEARILGVAPPSHNR